MSYQISWYNYKLGVQRNAYATLKAAKADLAEFKKDYPWNTYTLSKVIEVVEATAEPPQLRGTVVRAGNGGGGSI